MDNENRYHTTVAAKARGAVYTPARIASALVKWAIRAPDDRVLDPACGDGVFLKSARSHLASLGNQQPVCVGIDSDLQAAQASGGIHSDFFAWVENGQPQQFDAVVGNPPFIRSHLFTEASRMAAFARMQQMGIPASRLMSTWAPFVVLSCSLLTPQGRLAMVVPEELLHVQYAEPLRHFLLQRFRRVIIVLPTHDIFPTVQQSIVLLLCDNDPQGTGGLLELSFEKLENAALETVRPAPGWSWNPKWTHLFLTPTERTLITDVLHQLEWHPLSHYGRVEVGVVTGANDFFIVSQTTRQTLGNPDFFVPVLTSARAVSGIDMTATDFHQRVEQGKPAFLLNTATPHDALPLPLQTYLEKGKEAGIHRRFKCRNREPWYTVPGVRSAQALLLRQAGIIPRLVSLSVPCTCTDTVHRVNWQQPDWGQRHVVSFLNVWTLLLCELTGRSYGGGVLELMPGEANRLLLPPPASTLDNVFADIDRLVRMRQWEEAIRLVTEAVTPPAIRGSEQARAADILQRLIWRRKKKGKKGKADNLVEY
jgi:adenine-specific DNA-methyltransferase